MKIQVLYSPEDGDQQRFEFDPDHLMSVEAEMVEDLGGKSWDSYAEFWRKVESGNIRAWRALLWLLLRRTNPKLRFQDVVFRVDEFGIELDDEFIQESPKEPDAEPTDSPSAPPVSPPGSES